MNIILMKSAKNYMKRLSAIDKKRLGLALIRLQLEPPQGDIKPIKGMSNFFRVRVGDFRLVYSIVDGLIMVSNIGPRDDIYKKLR